MIVIPKCSDCVYFCCNGCLTCQVCQESITKINFQKKKKETTDELMAKYAKEKENGEKIIMKDLSKMLEVKCDCSETIDWHELKDFQGGLKKRKRTKHV